GAYGQLPGRDFNPLDLLLLLRTVQIRISFRVKRPDQAPGVSNQKRNAVTQSGFGFLTGSAQHQRCSIVGTNGADVIHALGGNDFVRGRGGDDVICGGDGNDLIAGNEDNDTIDGEGGRDRALYGGSTPVNANLAAGTAIGQGNDDLIAIEDLSGSSGADTLRGNAGPNRLWGFGGEDTLIGLGGNDILTGGPGPDALNGGPGNDFCNGSVGLGDTAVNCETTQFVP
ncbi:MAG: hypothetical protein GEU28_01065, partial [Dehalococcoidia bacterium]|nr:hypothetical protein [Dehalococcoidia bacterium]